MSCSAYTRNTEYLLLIRKYRKQKHRADFQDLTPSIVLHPSVATKYWANKKKEDTDRIKLTIEI